jgi:hypothetical protein
MKFGSRVNEICSSIDVNAISRMPRTNDVRRILLAVYGIVTFSSPSIADSPYENAARLDMEHLASSILAARAVADLNESEGIPESGLR